MPASLAFSARLPLDSLRGVAAVIDLGFRLQHGAVRNAARAVAVDEVNARARANALAALALVQPVSGDVLRQHA